MHILKLHTESETMVRNTNVGVGQWQ